MIPPSFIMSTLSILSLFRTVSISSGYTVMSLPASSVALPPVMKLCRVLATFPFLKALVRKVRTFVMAPSERRLENPEM